jgi:hypothetical protein
MGIDYYRLAKAVTKSNSKMKIPRENTYKFIKESVGSHYSEGGSDRPVPINIIRLAQNVYTRMLVSSNPKVLISTTKDALKMSAFDYEIAINQLVEEIKLKKSLRRLVSNAMFGIGVMKTGICAGKTVYIDNVKYELGQPYAEPVDMDYFGIDMSARTWDDAQYIFDVNKVPYDWALQSYGSDFASVLKPEKDNDFKNSKKSENISKGNYSKADKEEMSYKDMCEIVSIYLPQEQKIVTMAWNNGEADKRVLDESDYYGPEDGPYTPLTFNDVVGNILPLPPVALWYDIHDLANELYRKLGRQARNQKDILSFDPKNKDDAKRIQEAQDQSVVACRQPEKMTTLSYGGANQGLFAFFLNAQQQANKMTGNSDTLGGIGQTADTATQDKLIMSSASSQVQDMQAQVEEATTTICKKLAWYLFNDPFIEMQATKRLPGIPIDIPITITKEMLEGDYIDYNYVIKPYSLQEETPAGKFNTLTGIFSTIVMPLIPMLQEQGLTVDAQEFIEMIAKFKNIPELENMLISANNPNNEGKPSSKVYGSPPAKTTREYVRRDSGSLNPEAKEANKVINSFIGAGGMQ